MVRRRRHGRGDFAHLKIWWEHILDLGPEYGYQLNASKVWLVVKEDKVEGACTIFQGTGVAITAEGKRHLGAGLGTHAFVDTFVQQKVGFVSWSNYPPLPSSNHKLLMRPSHTVSSTSGPTWPGLSQTSKTCSSHWRM